MKTVLRHLATWLSAMNIAAMAGAEAVRPARPPKEPLTYGKGSAIEEGRRIILDEDSYPREPAKIVSGPTVAKKGDGYSIRFVLDKPDDVLVRIVDAGGNTARNLVCGVLGWNAPDPLKADSLEQEVFWDGKDADGKPAPPGCKVRLGVGLTPRFDRFVAYDPEQILPDLCALEVDAKGRVYVGLHTARRGDNHLVRYDRDGKFLENCFPPNLNLLDGKLEDVHRRVTYVDGKAVPSKRWLCWPHFSYKTKYGGALDAKYDGDSRHHWFSIRIAPDGRAFMADAGAAMDDLKGAWAGPKDSARSLGIARLVETDSGSKVRMMSVRLDPFWFLDYYCTGHGPWTLDSRGRAYVVRGNNPGAVIGGNVVPVAILKASWPDMKALNDFEYNGEEKLPEKRYFLGALSGKGQPSLFGMIADIAADAEGNLYVANEPPPKRGARREVVLAELKVFRSTGQPAFVMKEYELGGNKVDLGSVYGLRVSGGFLYVVARQDPVAGKGMVKGWRSGKLVKFGILPGPTLKAVWEAPVSGAASLVAVDSNAVPPIVWVGDGNGHATLTRIVDQGDVPGEVRHCGSGVRSGVLADPWAIALDGKQGIFVYDYARGRIVRTNDDGSEWVESDPIPANQTSFCYDKVRNLLYVAQGAKIDRFKSDLKPDISKDGKPYRTAGSALGAVNSLGDVVVGGGVGRYIMATMKGTGDERESKETVGGSPDSRFAGKVMMYDSQGNLKKEKFCVTYAPPAGIAMDSKGAVYVSDICVSKIAENMTEGWARGGKPIPCDSEVAYVVKFPSEGGVRLGESELWAHRGTSPQETGSCVCSVGVNFLFVDDSDRVFVTDFMKYHIKALDTAGNLIARIGSAGNADCRGPGSRFPEPQIAFWWVHSVAARGDFVYASDRDLRRIVKVRMDYREFRDAELPG